MPWLVYRLTNSMVLLGLIGFLSQIPVFLFSPFAGVVADNYERKKLLIVTQSLAMLQAFILGVLTLSGKLQIWHIVVLAAFIGIVNAFDMPTRQSFLFEMVGKDDLMNAIALNSSIFNSARLIGPAIAGVLIASFGEGMCFLLNSISFMAVIIALFLIRPLINHPADNNLSFFQRFNSGLEYIRKSKVISSVLLLLSVTGVISAFPMILMPVFVKEIYKLDATGLGVFMSAIGIGALVGTIGVAYKKTVVGIEKAIIQSTFFFGLFVVAFSISKNIIISVLFLIFVGYFLVSQMALSNTFIQLTIPDDMRGRVMGFYTMAFMGLAPVGCLAAGFFAHKLTAPVTVFLGGILPVLIAVIFRKRIAVK